MINFTAKVYTDDMKVGLALGGGGARGLAHIGVLRILEQNNIPIYQISGTSIGAIIGGLYSVYQNAEKVEEFIYKLVNDPAFKELNLDAFDPDPSKSASYWKQILQSAKRKISLYRTWRYRSMISEEQVSDIFKDYPDVAIDELPIKFSAIATDLISGRETVIVDGSLKKAVIASSSIPGVFPPVVFEKNVLTDGGISDLVPVYVARGHGSNIVIAIDVTKSLSDIEPLTNGLSIIDRAQTILAYQLSRERLGGADIVIRPYSTRYSWASVRYMAEIIKSGEEAALEAIPRIKELINGSV